MTIRGIVSKDLLNLSLESEYLEKRIKLALGSEEVSLIKRPDKVIQPGTPLYLNREGLLDVHRENWAEDESFFGTIPVRTEISVIPADPPGQRTIGWSMSEKIGVAAVSPNGGIRMTIVPPVVLTRPFPARGRFNLAAYYNASLQRLDVYVRDREESKDNIGCFSHKDGFELFDKAVGREKATAELLCRKAHIDMVMTYEGPKVVELVDDLFWQRFIDELPNTLVVAEIMLS